MNLHKKSIAYKTFVPTFAIIAVVAIALLLTVHAITRHIEEDYYRFIVRGVGENVSKILAGAASELTSANLTGNTLVVEAKQKSVREAVSLAWSRNGHDGIIVASGGEVVLSTLDAPRTRDIANHLRKAYFSLDLQTGYYHCYADVFPLWNWTVVTVNRNTNSLLSRWEIACLTPLVAFGAFLMSLGFFVVLRKNLHKPVSEMVDAVCGEREMRETGVAEFDRIGDAVNNVFLQLREKTSALEKELSERKKLEEQLLQSQKMEAVGQLAGGIAHDFNNLLMAILGYGELLQAEMSPDDPKRAYTEQVMTASHKAAGLTRALLAFSRKQIIDPKPTDLNIIVRNIEKLLRRVLGEDVDLKTNFSARDLIIMADSGQIDQVLVNLVANARDAMPKGGLLTIETSFFDADEMYVNGHIYVSPGHYACLSVADTGFGMDKKTKEKIFEPFFTTKEVGRGTGLGLAIVYGIVKQHDGFINVYSEPGKGTAFKILFPLAGREAADREEMPIPEDGTETVLIAEDDSSVRSMLRTMLETHGYKVVEAENGYEAVRIFQARNSEIDIALLDVIMPVKNGKAALKEMRRIRPDLKAVFISGYTNDIIHRQGILESGADFLEKPILKQQLLLKLREVLDR